MRTFVARACAPAYAAAVLGTAGCAPAVWDGIADARAPLAAPGTETAPPERLGDTGLADPRVEAFEPAYAEGGADGIGRRRAIWIPPGATVDATDMDHWHVPVGTRVWQELSIAGRRIETRMMTRLADDPRAWSFAVYVWNEAGTDAVLREGGVKNALGTGHDVPSTSACAGCHGQVRERLMGFNAVGLSHEGGGLTLERLASTGRLTTVSVEAPRETATSPAPSASPRPPPRAAGALLPDDDAGEAPVLERTSTLDLPRGCWSPPTLVRRTSAFAWSYEVSACGVQYVARCAHGAKACALEAVSR